MRIDFTAQGIGLPDLRLWLDPLGDCDAAWVSHGHGDHAAGTHGRVLGTPETIEVYRTRFRETLAPSTQFQPVAFGEPVRFGAARLTAYPAGHILGSAQLLIEWRSERVLYTGDVKRRPPMCGPAAQPVRCDRLIVESTFGLPVFHFLEREEARRRIAQFADECFEQNTMPVFLVHPLGRGQEVLHSLCEAGIPAAVHGAVARFIPLYEQARFAFPGWTPYESGAGQGQALVAVHGFQKTLQAAGRSFRAAYVSGWAALDNARARTGAEELIPYSDHADFEELLGLVADSGARQIDVVHGYTEAFARILSDRGYTARAAKQPAVREPIDRTGR